MNSADFFMYLPEEKQFTPGARYLARGRRMPYNGEYTHPHWVLDYAYEGGGKVNVNGGGFRGRKPGEAHLYPPGTHYIENSDSLPRRPFDVAFIVFSGGRELGLEPLTANPAGFAAIDDPDSRLAALFDRVGADCRAAGPDAWMAANMFLYETAILLKSLSAGRTSWRKRLRPNLPGTSPELWAESVRAHLQAALNGPVSLEKLAENMHCSVSTLTHEYRAVSGETVWKALLRLRVEAAKALLPGGRPLTEIARMTGFSSEFHLSRVFRRMTGLPPRGKARK